MSPTPAGGEVTPPRASKMNEYFIMTRGKAWLHLCSAARFTQIPSTHAFKDSRLWKSAKSSRHASAESHIESILNTLMASSIHLTIEDGMNLRVKRKSWRRSSDDAIMGPSSNTPLGNSLLRVRIKRLLITAIESSSRRIKRYKNICEDPRMPKQA